MKKKKFLIIFILLLIITIFSLLFWSDSLTSSKIIINKEFKYSVEQVKIRDLFAKETSLVAYTKFKVNYEVYDPYLVHNLAHLVGALLYKKEGLKGISICDAAFTWGCYHGFMGTAFENEGNQVWGDAEKFCEKIDKKFKVDDEECIHGIGHGLLALTNYSSADLTSSLKSCDIFKNKRYNLSCRDGVFMEYYSQNMMIVNEIQSGPRKFTQDQKYEPCARLPIEDQSDCFFQLPKWWVKSYPESQKTYVSLCMNLQNNFRESCLKGISHYIIFEENRHLLPSLMMCSAMPDLSHVKSCLFEVVKKYFGNRKDI